MMFPLIFLRSRPDGVAEATVLPDVSSLLKLNAEAAKRYGQVGFPVVSRLAGHAEWHQRHDSTTELVEKQRAPRLLTELDETEAMLRGFEQDGTIRGTDAADWTHARIVAIEAALKTIHDSTALPF